MSFGQRQRALLAVLAGTATVTNPVRALDPTELMAYHLGPVLLRPQAAAAERYDDNVFYRPSGPNQKGDFISTFSPGMILTLGRQEINNPWYNFKETEENYLSLSYNLDRSYYATYPQLNGTDHIFGLSDRIKGYRLTLEGSSGLAFMDDAIGGLQNLGAAFKRTVYSDNYTLSYALTHKTTVYLRGSYTADDFAAGTPLLDDNREAGTVGFDYLAFAKTSLFGETYYGQAAIHPNRPADGDGPHEDFVGGFVGIRGQFSTRIKGSVKVGYESRQFSDQTPAGGSPVVEATLNYRARERTFLALSYIRSTVLSVQAPSVSYADDSIDFRIDQHLGSAGKWLVTLDANYQFYSYDPAGVYAHRQDDWASLNLGVTYYFRMWLRTNLAYALERFSSSFANKGATDYTANRVTLKVALGY